MLDKGSSNWIETERKREKEMRIIIHTKDPICCEIDLVAMWHLAEKNWSSQHTTHSYIDHSFGYFWMGGHMH